MKKWNIKLNLIAPIQIIVSLILGFTGLVNWWVIAFVWLMHTSFDIEI